MSQLKNRLFKDRIKQIVIIQSILLIPMLIFLVYSFLSESNNHVYSGLFYILAALINYLGWFEDKILKKNNPNNFSIWLAIMFFIIGIVELFDIIP